MVKSFVALAFFPLSPISLLYFLHLQFFLLFCFSSFFYVNILLYFFFFFLFKVRILKIELLYIFRKGKRISKLIKLSAAITFFFFSFFFLICLFSGFLFFSGKCSTTIIRVHCLSTISHHDCITEFLLLWSVFYHPWKLFKGKFLSSRVVFFYILSSSKLRALFTTLIKDLPWVESLALILQSWTSRSRGRWSLRLVSRI